MKTQSKTASVPAGRGAKPQSRRPGPPAEAAAWSREPVALAGNWEPLIFRRRRGNLAADAAAQYAREHTEALVRDLQAHGVNLLITHYFKGFGLKAEAPDIAQARKLIGLCHRAGIRVGGYIGDTMILETLLHEEPAARGWRQVDADGRGIQYGGTQSFRFKWCRNNPAFMAYMKRVLRQGLRDGLDLIHFDNFLEKPEPLSCHCRWCTAAFRRFLRTTLTPAQRIERLGFADVRHVVPPIFSRPLYSSWSCNTIGDPLIQEWVRFRCAMLADRYRQLTDFCRSINPAVVIECNPTGIWGENTAYIRGVEHAALLPSGSFFWDESPNPYGLLENGALCTHLRTMKLGEPLNNRVFFYARSELTLAEGLAFNGGCLGMIGHLRGDHLQNVHPRYPDYRALVQAHPDLFCRSRSLARVAVYRNFASLAWNSVEPHLQAILAEQTLLEAHIPFDILATLKAVDYRVLILPGMECLTREELAALRAFVTGGGTVILTGDAGTYDGWRRRLTDNPFAGLPEDRVIRLPALQLPGTAPSLADRVVWDDFYRVIDGRFWLRPANEHVLLDALKRMPGDPLTPVTVRAPRTTLIEPRQGADGRLLIHIIPCDARRQGARLTFHVSAQTGGDAFVLLVPGRAEQPIRCERNATGINFSLALNAAYGVVVQGALG